MLTGDATPIPGWRGGDGNAAYLDKTLRYQPIELSLNESVNGKTIFFLWLRAALAGFVVFVIPGFFGFLSLVSGLGGEPSYGGYGSYDTSGGSSSGEGWFIFASLASVAVFWVVLLMTRLPEPVAEWRVLLADRPDRAPHVYATITRTLSTRHYPIVPTALDTRITLNNPPYTAYVSVFNYGSSLYLGWMMWRSRRGTELIGQFLGDFFRGLRGDNGIERQLLRSEGARAMREAVHLACREGLMVAVDGAPAPGGPSVGGPTVPTGGPTPGAPTAGGPAAPGGGPAVPPQAPFTPPPPTAPPVVPPTPPAPGASGTTGAPGASAVPGASNAPSASGTPGAPASPAPPAAPTEAPPRPSAPEAGRGSGAVDAG